MVLSWLQSNHLGTIMFLVIHFFEDRGLREGCILYTFARWFDRKVGLESVWGLCTQSA